MGKSYIEKVAFEKGLWRMDWILIESLQGVIPGRGKDGQSMSVSSPQTFSEQCETSSACWNRNSIDIGLMESQTHKGRVQIGNISTTSWAIC